MRAPAGLLAAPVIVVALLFAGALAGVVRASLVPLGGAPSLQAWESLLADGAFFEALWFTLAIAAVAGVLSAGAALVLATLLRGRRAGLTALLTLPVAVPHLLVAVLAVLWLAPGGLADRLLGGLPANVVRDEWGAGIVLVYAWKEIPFLVLLLLAASGRTLGEREEAGRVLGLTALQRVRWISWPALRGPLVVGTIIVTAYVIGSFEVPLVVGPNHPQTLAAYALDATRGDLITGQGPAAAALLVATLLTIVLAAAAAGLAKDVEGR